MQTGSFGEIVFEHLRGPEQVTQEIRMGYAEFPVAGGKARLQATGEDLDRFSMVIRLHDLIDNMPMDVRAELARLEQIARTYEVLPLFLGPVHKGDYVIKDMTVQHLSPRRADVTLNLSEYR